MDSEQSLRIGWIPLVNREVVLRSAFIAIVIGSILTLINQFGWVAGGDPLQFLPLLLVFVTPFVVVAVSQVVGVRRAHIDIAKNGEPASSEGFIVTTLSHGIPVRAVTIGLVIGSCNAIITLVSALLHSGGLATMPLVPLSQAYALPLLFGLFSQTVSYRRAVHLVPEDAGHGKQRIRR